MNRILNKISASFGQTSLCSYIFFLITLIFLRSVLHHYASSFQWFLVRFMRLSWKSIRALDRKSVPDLSRLSTFDAHQEMCQSRRVNTCTIRATGCNDRIRTDHIITALILGQIVHIHLCVRLCVHVHAFMSTRVHAHVYMCMILSISVTLWIPRVVNPVHLHPIGANSWVSHCQLAVIFNILRPLARFEFTHIFISITKLHVTNSTELWWVIETNYKLS